MAKISSPESKSMNHSTSQIHKIVKNNNKIWETGKVLIALVQFQNSFFNFIDIWNEIKTHFLYIEILYDIARGFIVRKSLKFFDKYLDFEYNYV